MEWKKMVVACVGFALLVGIVAVNGYGVPANQISPYNGACDQGRTKDEFLEVWWTNIGSPSSTAQWQNTKIPDFLDVAHRVDNRTLGYPNAPFVYADDNAPWNNGDPWSDTWGVCAYFSLVAYHDTIASATNTPDPVLNLNQVDLWDNYTGAGTPSTTWRIVCVNGLPTGLYGWTKIDTKLTILRKSSATRHYLHEWGHCNEPEPDSGGNNPNPAGIYLWPYAGSHYGQYDSSNSYVAQPYYGFNFMHYADDNGRDGDYNFRHEKYPWFRVRYWNSFRWDENF